MIGDIRNSKLHFKFFTLEWLNHFGVPLFFFTLIIIDIYSIFISSGSQQITFIKMLIILAILTIITFSIQCRKLNFKILKPIEPETFYSLVKGILLRENWVINANNKKTIIQATLNSELLTIEFKNNVSNWNIIFHPYNRNSLMSILSGNKNGHKVIAELKSACA